MCACVRWISTGGPLYFTLVLVRSFFPPLFFLLFFDSVAHAFLSIPFSGIINTNLASREYLIDLQAAFSADVILVVDHERLFNELTTKSAPLFGVFLVSLSPSSFLV